MDYKDTFLAREDEKFKNLYSNNIKSGNFLSFFKTEEDNDCMILCMEYNIKGHLEYCHDMDKRVHFHYIINRIQHLTLKSPIQIISNSKKLKSTATNNDEVKTMPKMKPIPVTSSDIQQDATPQFDYNLPSMVDPKTNKPINPPTTFKFEEQTLSIINNINQKEFMKIDTLKLKHKDNFFKWYKDIFTHGFHQGIYISILSSTTKDSTIGKAWKTLHPSKQNQHDDMMYTIGRLLNHDNIFPKDANNLRNIVSAANINGYTSLQHFQMKW
eukprot:317043-Ditylum_brightwellii.AAC.1